MGPFACVGLSGAIILAKLFEVLAEDIFRHKSTALDNRFSLWLHGFTNPGLDKFFKFFSFMGSIASVIVMTLLGFGVLVRSKHPHAAWLLAMSTGGGVVINQALKPLFQRPRPELWASQQPRTTTFSFPSGQATVSFCFGGGLGWLGYKFIKSRLALGGWLTSIMVGVILVGLSRIYRGMHYLTDVVGGYICGSFWLALLLSGVSIYDRLHSPQRSQ